ncbi:unnamed protein product [Cercopithifilaria johnstoni]|uniref:Uncharacterized protein n=1 Tax=Cercopithifilaria johnstoni TaxID=2874296 RepID=A0A8J2M663_9BILA|nr:unnamed protein product [Cercopithifilaria johnstoni]
MCSHPSKIENIEQLCESNVNHPCYNIRKMTNRSGRSEKRKTTNITIPSGIEETSKLHTHMESPPSLPVIDDYNIKSSNSKLESKKEQTANDSNVESSDVFRKRGTQNNIAVSLVVFSDQMINKRRLTIAIISCICGIYAIYIALSRNSSVYGYESRHQSAYTIKNILLLYGMVQLLLSTIFFCIYTITKINENKWCCQIFRFIGCIIYLLIALFVLLIGIIGFYWVLKLYGHVEYEDRQSVDYVDIMLYNSSMFIFSFNLCFALLKCCWWN